MHEVTFSLTGRDLEAVQHIADARAEEYFTRAGLEPLLSWSRAKPNWRKIEGGGHTADGWRVTFAYRSRPGPDPVPSRLADDGLPADPEFDVDPDPVTDAARQLSELQQRRGAPEAR